MMPLLIACSFGFSGALFVYALRGKLLRRYERDQAWLEHTIWRFVPQPKPVRGYVLAYYCSAIALLALLLFLLANPFVAIAGWSLVIFIPRWVAAAAWSKRRKVINEQLPGTVRKLSSSVGSGLSLAQAIERTAVRAPAPIRTEFYVISSYWKMGADFATSIEEAKRRLGLPNFTLFASAIVVNQRMGGNVTATLDRLASSLESIASMQRDVHAATSEGRMNIKVLAVAPFLMLGLTSFMDREAVVMLFTTFVGQLVLGFCFSLTAIGTWWAWQIVKSDV
ncbi:MAG: tight adherence protein B [Planctomycetota bacterium]|jgi:tight adherence protein B